MVLKKDIGLTKFLYSLLGNEIRKYISIIEELTEDKLGLERNLNDLEQDKLKWETDLARLNEDYSQMKNEMSFFDSEKESTVRSAKEETKLLLCNLQSLREENEMLEENLKVMDEDRREVLGNLKQAEEDRLGFIRTLQLISEQKESLEEQLEIANKENQSLKGQHGNYCSLNINLQFFKIQLTLQFLYIFYFSFSGVYINHKVFCLIALMIKYFVSSYMHVYLITTRSTCQWPLFN